MVKNVLREYHRSFHLSRTFISTSFRTRFLGNQLESKNSFIFIVREKLIEFLIYVSRSSNYQPADTAVWAVDVRES